MTHHRRYQMREEAKQEIFEYIEVFYNHQRSHSTIGYQMPFGYEKNTEKLRDYLSGKVLPYYLTVS